MPGDTSQTDASIKLRVDAGMSGKCWQTLEQSHPAVAKLHLAALDRANVSPMHVAEACKEIIDCAGSVPARSLAVVLANAASAVIGLYGLYQTVERDRRALVAELAELKRVAPGAGRVVARRAADGSAAANSPARSLDPPSDEAADEAMHAPTDQGVER